MVMIHHLHPAASLAGGSNDVRVPYNPCGCIYGFDLTPQFDVTRMYGEHAKKKK